LPFFWQVLLQPTPTPPHPVMFGRNMIFGASVVWHIKNVLVSIVCYSLSHCQ
jgi:hypothetical protein